MSASDDLDDLVRRVDPDRWLSSRFIVHQATRAGVIALYAFDHELARAKRVASNPLIAEMRLVWWREALDEIFEGRTVRAHPTARALAEVIERKRVSRAPLDNMVEGRVAALDADLAGVERAGAGVALAAAAALNGGSDHPPDLSPIVSELGAIWARVMDGRGARAAPELFARFNLVRRSSGLIPAAILPAVLHLALAGPELAGRRPSGVEARIRLLRASLTGRF